MPKKQAIILQFILGQITQEQMIAQLGAIGVEANDPSVTAAIASQGGTAPAVADTPTEPTAPTPAAGEPSAADVQLTDRVQRVMAVLQQNDALDLLGTGGFNLDQLAEEFFTEEPGQFPSDPTTEVFDRRGLESTIDRAKKAREPATAERGPKNIDDAIFQADQVGNEQLATQLRQRRDNDLRSRAQLDSEIKQAGQPQRRSDDEQLAFERAQLQQQLELKQQFAPERAARSLDELTTKAILDGDFELAQAVRDFRNEPTSVDRAQLALQLARSPGDLRILSQIASGFEVPGFEQVAPGQVGTFPKSQEVQSLAQDFLNPRDPFAAQRTPETEAPQAGLPGGGSGGLPDTNVDQPRAFAETGENFVQGGFTPEQQELLRGQDPANFTTFDQQRQLADLGFRVETSDAGRSPLPTGDPRVDDRAQENADLLLQQQRQLRATDQQQAVQSAVTQPNRNLTPEQQSKLPLTGEQIRFLRQQGFQPTNPTVAEFDEDQRRAALPPETGGAVGGGGNILSGSQTGSREDIFQGEGARQLFRGIQSGETVDPFVRRFDRLLGNRGLPKISQGAFNNLLGQEQEEILNFAQEAGFTREDFMRGLRGSSGAQTGRNRVRIGAGRTR